MNEKGVFCKAVIFIDTHLLQSTITAIIPAKIPAAIPSARIAMGKAAAELGDTVAVAVSEAEITVEVEVVAALEVLGAEEEVKADVNADVSVAEVVIERETGTEVDEVEVVGKPELVDVESVVREVFSGTASDGVLELKKKIYKKSIVRMKKNWRGLRSWECGSGVKSCRHILRSSRNREYREEYGHRDSENGRLHYDLTKEEEKGIIRDCSWKGYEPQILHLPDLATPSLYRSPTIPPSQVYAGIKHRETAQHNTAYYVEVAQLFKHDDGHTRWLSSPIRQPKPELQP